MSGQNDNGRITLAVIRNDITHLTATVAELAAELRRVCENYEDRLSDLETWQASRITRWEEHDKEHERESLALKAWSTIGSAIAAVLASIIGVFVKRP
jgi:hypothetical protein